MKHMPTSWFAFAASARSRQAFARGVLFGVAFVWLVAVAGGASETFTLIHGGITRGDPAVRRLALVFTGHEFAEGGERVLGALDAARVRASFFLTGDFARNSVFAALIRRIVAAGHYVGPHSDKHLLYCDWSERRTLIDRATFERDVLDNLRALEPFGIRRASVPFWIPPYEWYNADIAAWSDALGLRVVNFTPGTRANADYTGETDANFVASAAILESIRTREAQDPNGLNGFILLMHVGAGPGRKDKFHDRLPELLGFLRSKGYEPVRLDVLLGSPKRRSGDSLSLDVRGRRTIPFASGARFI
jgi:peptidoglycan/xylan/chitin deacetylase (PgdA/CDA1 family)